MRPLTLSLNREELSELLDVPPSVVDALLDSGRVLCHFRGGEPRIPLAQMETFLRETLMRVYQAEAHVAAGAPMMREAALNTSAAAFHDPEPLPEAEPEPLPRPDRDPEPEPEPLPEPMPEPMPAPQMQQAQRRPVPAASAILASPAPPPATAAQRQAEQRIADRYVPLRQLTGIFGDMKFVVMQLSATGLRIRHNEPLMPGEEAKLSFALIKPARSVVVRARVVWTSVARSGSDSFAISGLRIVEHQDRLVSAIESLRALNELQPERRAATRRAADGIAILNGISDDEMALVTAALQKFANDPVEASRWYSRGRFALSDETVRRSAPERPRDREEVLGVWEYLDRQIDISKIAGVMSWLRSGMPGAQ